jgi:uncharacterized protein YoxC
MTKLHVKRLERDETLREFLYHIKGIVEASDNLVDLAKTLDEAYQRNAETFADTTSLIEVQALHHLGYHVKSLRTPLRRLQREAYAHVEDNGKRPSKRVRTDTANQRAKKAARRRLSGRSARRR